MTNPSYGNYRRNQAGQTRGGKTESMQPKYGVDKREFPVAEIRSSPADRQLGSAFGSKLKIVGLI